MEEMKPVVFKLDNENYGVDIGRVLGIEREQQIVRVPNTVSYIKGIMNLRGEIIPVYDLRKKFGSTESGYPVHYCPGKGFKDCVGSRWCKGNS